MENISIASLELNIFYVSSLNTLITSQPGVHLDAFQMSIEKNGRNIFVATYCVKHLLYLIVK